MKTRFDERTDDMQEEVKTIRTLENCENIWLLNITKFTGSGSSMCSVSRSIALNKQLYPSIKAAKARLVAITEEGQYGLQV